MKQFNQYLYEYQADKRIRNIGFVKAELKDRAGRIRIQARGFEPQKHKEIEVYLLCAGKDGWESVFQGKIPKKTPAINYVLEFSGKDIGGAETTDDIVGIFFRDDRKNYAACWGEENFRSDNVREWKETETAKACDLEERADVFEKIQRKDLARLPRKHWRIANNNFLLHGFYNYHHLLWLEENGEVYIGVPGVNHAREVQAARVFGFTEFKHLKETGLTLSSEEKNEREDFGYFCRRME